MWISTLFYLFGECSLFTLLSVWSLRSNIVVNFSLNVLLLSVHFSCCYATSYLWLCNVRLCRSSGKTSSSFLAWTTPWTLLILPRWNSTPDDDDFVDEGYYGDDNDNDADDLNDPLGNSRSHRSETQSHFLSIRQFSPLPIGHWTNQCVAFRAQFSRRFMFCPNPSVGLCEHIGVSHSPSIRSNQSVLWTLRPQLFTPSPSSHHQQSADLLFITALCSRK